MRTQFTKAARKHRIGVAHARFVIATTTPVAVVANAGSAGLLWVGEDDRGVELEVMGVQIPGDPAAARARDREDFILVIHVMPTRYRKGL